MTPIPLFTAALLAALANGEETTYLNHYDFPDCSRPPLQDSVVCNTHLSPVERARGLVSQLTLQEKVINTQNEAPGVSRLGLPAYNWWSESLHGLSSGPGTDFADDGDYSYATAFPQVINFGASFDDQLVYQMASVASTEARAFSNAGRSGLDYWAPNVNPFKDPRWGRGQETPGEDVLHVQRYAISFVTGLQGPDRKKVIANCKHFVAYDMEAWNGTSRHQFNAQVSRQDLAEYYLPTFKACARDAQAGSVMCSYNAINGIPACANLYYLQTILRDHWGWGNHGHWVTSDCRAVEDVFDGHNYTDSLLGAAAHCMNAGTDTNCNPWVDNAYGAKLEQAVKDGLVDESVLDRALVRLYTSLIELGYFDSDSPYRRYTFEDVGTKEATELAYNAAVEGMVLLKNDGALPWIPSQDTRVAILGPFANASEMFLGNYAGKARQIPSPIEVADSFGWQLVTNPAEAEIVIYFGGIDNNIESEDRDRVEITWPQSQLDEILDISGQQVPLVVVQFGGGQVDDAVFLRNENVAAILWAGYPGQEGSRAIFDVITGKKSPAGRLSVTQYPADYVSLPMTDMSLRPSDKKPGRTYRWFDDAVLEFGHGLHYTDFAVSFMDENTGNYDLDEILTVYSDAHYLDKVPFATVKVEVTNTGSRVSDYVTLLFVRTQNAGPRPYPRKTLVSYRRDHNIRPGETRLISLQIELGTIARVRENGDLVAYPGHYEFQLDLGGPTLGFEIFGREHVLESLPSKESNVSESAVGWLGLQNILHL